MGVGEVGVGKPVLSHVQHVRVLSCSEILTIDNTGQSTVDINVYGELQIAFSFFSFNSITSWCLGSMALPLVSLTFLFLLARLFYSKSPSTPISLKKQTSIADVVSDSLKSLNCRSATVQEISHHQDEEANLRWYQTHLIRTN